MDNIDSNVIDLEKFRKKDDGKNGEINGENNPTNPGKIIILDKEKITNFQIHSMVKNGLQNTPEHIKPILDSENKSLEVLKTKEEFRSIVFEVLVRHLDKKKHDFSPDIISALTYLSDLMYKILNIEKDEEIKEILNEPYGYIWLSKGNFKAVGDIGVYNYCFGKDHKYSLTKAEQEKYVSIGYSVAFGENFAHSACQVLPGLDNFTTKFGT